jgi:hypothetical protein
MYAYICTLERLYWFLMYVYSFMYRYVYLYAYMYTYICKENDIDFELVETGLKVWICKYVYVHVLVNLFVNIYVGIYIYM